VPFNTPGRDFDPAFSADGRTVYFCSDRAGGQGGDDLYRVSMGSDGRFGEPVNLGPAVNSAADEFAPMLSPDAATLLFSSDRAGGAGGHDLYIAAMVRGMAQPARPLPGDLNTAAQEFDATFLGDGRTVVFARAQDFGSAPVRQFIAYARGGRYDAGHALPSPLNEASGDSYGAMLDGSQPGTLTYSARRADGAGLDLYRIRYQMSRP
jgi:TolB protein